MRLSGVRLASLGLIAAVGAALVAPAGVPGAADPGPTGPNFCERTIVVKVPWFPGWEPNPDGELGFGPPRIRMRILPRLVAVGGKVGYELFLHSGARAHPHWRVRTSLSRFRPPGLHLFMRSKERQVQTIGRDRSVRFLFEVPIEPAYYMVTAFFTSPNGRRAFGFFRFYFRAIRPTRAARLSLDADSYARGQTVFARIESHGTEPVLYGAGYRIERYDGTSWSLAPESPDIFILPLYSAFPGESGEECSAFPIPSSMAPGHYRMTKEVGFGRPAREGEEATVTAEFDVLP